MGIGIKKEIRTFTTMTNDLLRLKDWLKDNRITHVAMESPGVYWKPVFNIRKKMLLRSCPSMPDT